MHAAAARNDSTASTTLVLEENDPDPDPPNLDLAGAGAAADAADAAAAPVFDASARLAAPGLGGSKCVIGADGGVNLGACACGGGALAWLSTAPGIFTLASVSLICGTTRLMEEV